MTSSPSTRRALFLSAAAVVLALGFAAPLEAARSEGIDCRAQVFDPVLDFEFRYFSSFRVEFPLGQIAGPKREFRVRTAVTPMSHRADWPTVFERGFEAGPIPEGAKQKAELSGSFVTGEGRYVVEWSLEDDAGALCVVRWPLDVKRSRKERDLKLNMEPGEVGDSRVLMFRPEKAVFDSSGPPLRVKVFLSLDVPRRRNRVSAKLYEFMPRIAALRSLSRHPRIGQVSLVVYSIDEQQVYHRHGLQDGFDFPVLARAVRRLEPGFVSIDQLGKHKERDFFSRVLLEELPGDEEVDAYIFLGPEIEYDQRVPKETVNEIGPLPAPAYYFRPSYVSWKGLIGKTVSRLDGKAYRVATPHDLAEATADMVGRLERRRGK